MNQSFYAAAVAASQQQLRLNVHANNLANVNTVGFKGKAPSFADLLYRDMTGPEDAQLHRGAGSRMIQATTEFAEGPLRATGGEQDYAIAGRGFFAIEDGQTGEVFYTRAGNFHLGSVQENGQAPFYLCDAGGRFVLDQNRQRIPVQDATAECPVGVFDFANTDGMLHAGSNLLVPVDKNGPALAGEGLVRHGMLEQSNTDVGKQFGKVIEAQRSFSYALKMVQTADEVESTLNALRG